MSWIAVCLRCWQQMHSQGVFRLPDIYISPSDCVPVSQANNECIYTSIIHPVPFPYLAVTCVGTIGNSLFSSSCPCSIRVRQWDDVMPLKRLAPACTNGVWRNRMLTTAMHSWVPYIFNSNVCIQWSHYSIIHLDYSIHCGILTDTSAFNCTRTSLYLPVNIRTHKPNTCHDRGCYTPHQRAQ